MLFSRLLQTLCEISELIHTLSALLSVFASSEHKSSMGSDGSKANQSSSTNNQRGNVLFMLYQAGLQPEASPEQVTRYVARTYRYKRASSLREGIIGARGCPGASCSAVGQAGGSSEHRQVLRCCLGMMTDHCSAGGRRFAVCCRANSERL